MKTGLFAPLIGTFLLLQALAGSAVRAHAKTDLPLAKIKLPPGFQIELFAKELEGARSLAISPSGIVWVGSQSAGRVYAIMPQGQLLTVISGLNQPNGVAFHKGSLYVAEISRILRFDGLEELCKKAVATGETLLKLPSGQPAVVNSSFPHDTHHGWKFIAFGPDDLLYVPVGAPCNVCEKKEPYASILRMKPDGTQLEVFARGVRNTVGFDWNPESRELWFTDNGRDMLGDDLPSDKLNRAPRKGLNFGFPYCHGAATPDPDFGKEKKCPGPEFTPPERELGAHVASLGMRFYSGKMFPPEYKGQIFIAEHGSWNRSIPVGYRVELVKLRDGKAVSDQPFAEGWLQDEAGTKKAWGRPVDVLTMPDGALLVSDDLNGVIYRISYKSSSVR